LRVLITGGCGFIGSHVAERRVARGDDVLVIDNFETGQRDNLVPGDRLVIVEGSIADRALMRELFADFKPDAVLHAAASYKDPGNFIGDADTNAHGSAITAACCKQANVRRLVYLQTALCYGDPVEQPVTLDHRLDPSKSSYAISKTAGEMYVALSGLDYISFRLANVYGPRNLSGPLPAFYQRLTTGRPCFVTDTRRDFIFVDDVADIVSLALEGTGSRGAYHIASGKDVALKELYDATVEALGIDPRGDVEVRPLGPDDVYSILLDPSKTLADFGVIPSRPLKDGIRRTLEYYRRHGVPRTYTHLAQEDGR
jgi:UDP-glucose 4-epimerase